MAATLRDVINQLQENRESQDDTTQEVFRVGSRIDVLLQSMRIQSLDALDATKRASSQSAQTTATKGARSGGGGSTINVSGIKGLGLLGGAGILLSGLGKFIKGAGIGLGAASAGLGAFFIMLAKADKDLPNGGENVKKLLSNVAKGLEAFSDRDAKGFAGLLATGAIFGALRGPIGGLAVGVGIAAVGAGLGGFMFGLGLSEMGLDKMLSTGESLKKFMVNLATGLEAFGSQGMLALGAAMGAGGAAGLLFGVGKKPFLGKVGRAVGALFGLPAIGAGISGFMAALGLGDKGLGFLKSDGANIGSFLKNLGEGLKAFGSKELIAAGTLLLGSALFGFATGGVGAVLGAIGIVAIGAGIAGFVAELAVLDKGLGFLKADGSGLSKFSVGIADAMIELNRIPEGIGEKVGAVGKLGLALAGLVTGFGVAQLQEGVVDGFKSLSNFLFGTKFENQATSRANFIKTLVDAVMPLQKIPASLGSGLDKLGDSLVNFVTNFNTVGKKLDVESFSETFLELGNVLAVTRKLVFAMANGGTFEKPGFLNAIASKLRLGGEINFGPEGSGGMLNPNLKLDQLVDKMSQINFVLGRSNIGKPAVGENSSSSVNNQAVNNQAPHPSNNFLNQPITNNTNNSSSQALISAVTPAHDPNFGYDQYLRSMNGFR